MPATPHVFVTCGDLTYLACDAWLVPTDRSLVVEEAWTLAGHPAPAPRGWSDDGLRAFAGPGTDDDPRLRVWTNVGAEHGQGVEWFVEGARQFVHVAAEALHRRAADTGAPLAHHRRVRPLLALPVVGTGLGGGADRTGDIVHMLLPAIEEAAHATGLDVCLVTRSDRAHAAAQAVRRTRGVTTFDENLSEQQQSTARSLARRAVEGELVLFIGAGVGIGAGLPAWDDLLAGLARSVGYTEPDIDAMANIDALDRARLILARCSGGQAELARRVCDAISAPWRSLSHTLLASLPVREAASTNYDQLFERASEDAGRPAAILPYAPSRERSRWVLKLHGCCSHPEDIVLTRDDYLRFAERRAALAGVVQALLVTRHMLFVGFSLTDDNFYRIVHDVRQALGHSKAKEGRFGTALLLGSGPLLAELWRGDLDVVSMIERDECGRAEAARRVEVFLDYIGMLAADGASHLLDETFAGALTEGERVLAEQVRDLRTRMPANAWDTAAGRRLRALFSAWGMRDA